MNIEKMESFQKYLLSKEGKDKKEKIDKMGKFCLFSPICHCCSPLRRLPHKSNNFLRKVNSLFCKVIFFPPKFLFPIFKRKIWWEKNYFANERNHTKMTPNQNKPAIKLIFLSCKNSRLSFPSFSTFSI
jgi:hypothetical protein